MIPIVSLWLPILLSAVLTFVVSAIIWMMMPWHKTDHAAVPDEDALLEALRAQKMGTGVYLIPFGTGGAGTPEYQAKVAQGPMGTIRIMTTAGAPAMGPRLLASFLLYVVIGCFAAYVATRTLSPGADYMAVFRITATVVFICHSVAHFHDVIWFGQRLSTALKNSFDALIYGLLAGGAFGWLWPM